MPDSSTSAGHGVPVTSTVAVQPGASGTSIRSVPGGSVNRSHWATLAVPAAMVTGAPASATARPGSSQAPSGSGCGRRQACAYAGSP